jgi:general stress protein 13
MALKVSWKGLVDAVCDLEEKKNISRAEVFEMLEASGRYAPATAKQIQSRFYYELKKLDENEEIEKEEVPTMAIHVIEKDKFFIGDVMTGVVSGIQPYGAFLELPNGDSGLLHVSEMGKNVLYGTVEDYLAIGDELKVKVIGRDSKGIKLSCRALGVDLTPIGIDEPQKEIESVISLRPVKSNSLTEHKKFFESFLKYVSDLEIERDALKTRVVELEGALADKNSREHEFDTIVEQLKGLISQNV